MRLTLEEIRKPRSWAEFHAFFTTVSDGARANEETKRRFRLESGAYKRWRDEVMPLMQFCKAESVADSATIQVFADDGPVDAQISGFPSSADTTTIEITRAIDGQDERLRMELLTEKGSAPGAGPIRRVQLDGVKVIEAELESQSHEDIASRLIRLASDSIIQKGAKKYPPSTWLLVDAVEFRTATEEIRPRIHAECAKVATQTSFDRVYLLAAYRDEQGRVQVASSRLK